MKRVVHHDGILSWARGALSSLFGKVSMLGVDKRELGEFSYPDPLQFLSEYVAKHSPRCDMVLVHDDYWERILGIGNRTLNQPSLEMFQPARVMKFLKNLKPEIGVMTVKHPMFPSCSKLSTQILRLEF